MDKTTTAETQYQGRRIASKDADDTTIDRRLERRAALRTRHAQGVTRLMEQREDLRGVLPLADFVDDAVRWTA